MLHEISIRRDEKIGNNVEALREKINDIWYMTLRNDQGEPIHIFSQNEASITFIKRTSINKLQLLMQVHETFYILSFSSYTQTKQFSDALLKYVSILALSTLDDDPYPRIRYKSNRFSVEYS